MCIMVAIFDVAYEKRGFKVVYVLCYYLDIGAREFNLSSVSGIGIFCSTPNN